MLINFNPINIYKKNLQNVQNLGYGKYPNLAPLSKDTVSFGARAMLMGANMSDAPTMRDCYQVSLNAEPTKLFLEKLLDKYLSRFVKEDENDKSVNKPILTYYARVKSPTSIREKVVSKYNKIASQDAEKFCTESIDALMEHFPLKKGVSRKKLIDESKKLFSNTQLKFAPYGNVALSFSKIINMIDDMKAMDFSSKEEFLAVCTQIINSFESDEDSDKENVYINPQSISGIKHYANDVVGARIVLADSKNQDTAKILSALKKAVENGEIKITSVESNLPDPKKLPEGMSVSDYEYASHETLRRFADETNSKLEEHKSKTGYLAIHLNIEFTAPELSYYKDKFKGYSGEIQIIGRDVLQLKEVEDLCYKIKDNKNAIHRGYQTFVDYFKKYYKDDIKEAFDDYTYALYLAQRALGPEERKDNSFPSIKELGFENRVPEELDFNKLKKIKDGCDVIYESLSKQEENAVKKSK